MISNLRVLLCLSFFLAVGHVEVYGQARADFAIPQNTTGWSWPTLPPEFTDWSPGGPFPTLGPGTTLVPPEWIADAKVDIPVLGTIQGAVSFTSPVTAPSSRKFYWFAGVPYADPDSYTGNNRFKPSSVWKEDTPLPKNNNGVFSAINPLLYCPQADILPTSGDLGDVLKSVRKSSKIRSERKAKGISPKAQGVEDCLVININTPNIPKDENEELLPVIVFLHGGSFDILWGGIFGGHRFLNRNVVFISINYRLGILGALNLGIDDAPGNAAMYDVVTSLKWIKKYIHHFGGDASKVTLTGHSAGAAMASLLLTSPLAIDSADDKLLVHQIATLSGSSLSVWAMCEEPMTHHIRTATLAGCYNDAMTPQQIRDCLASKDVADLITAVDTYSDMEREEGRLGYDAKAPSLQDPTTLSPGFPIFMSKTPYEAMKAQEQHDMPIMLGATRHDGTFVMEDTYEKFLKKHNYTEDPNFMRNEMMPFMVETTLGMSDPSGDLIHSLANMYLGEALYTDDFESKIPGLIDIHSVFGFKAGAYGLVEMNSKKNPHSYYFAFEYQGMWTVDGGDVIPGGVGHVDAVFYLFQAFPLIIPRDQAVAYRFVDYWANFAIYGNPNGEGPQTLASPYNELNHAYLKIDSYDSTRYYCRDSWANNSLEIMKSETTESPPTNPSEGTTGPTGETTGPTGEPTGPTDEPTGPTGETTRPPEATTGGGDSSVVHTKFEVLCLFILLLSYFK